MGNGLPPSEIQFLWVSRAKTPMTFQYKFKGTTLMEEKTTKYRGVDLQANLAWNHHINHHINRVTKTKKTNSMLGVLRRNLRYASEKTKTQAYVSMVRSNLDYCCTIWNPYHQDQKHQVEMVQRRAARFVTNRYRNTSCVTDMLGYIFLHTQQDFPPFSQV